MREVQSAFNSQYPYLKIEFFRTRPKKAVPTTAANRLMHYLTVNQARLNKRNGQLELSDSMKVADLEQAFHDNYGLNVQVFRKSGRIWLETTMTDGWTLKQQNDHGREISTINPSA